MSLVVEKAKEHQQEILWWEICSILHDIGKLSSDFLRYRQTWMRLANGWGQRDPHDNKWFDRDSLLDLVPGLREFFCAKIPVAPPPGKGKVLSVEASVHEHTCRDTTNPLVQLLKIGDQIDSIYDRNNPLISNEQSTFDGKRIIPAYRSTVFGYEGARTLVDPAQADQLRLDLYKRLALLFKAGDSKATHVLDADAYRKIKSACEEHLDYGMSDTTRPSNDTSLWEHVYAVASIAKAAHALEVSAPEQMQLKDSTKFTFDLWGIGVDTWRWCSFGQRIGDVVGRQKVVECAHRAVRTLVEYKIPIGNSIYQDDSFQVFLTAPLSAGERQHLEQEARAAFEGSSAGELRPASCWLDKQHSTTGIVTILSQLHDLVQTPSNWVCPTTVQPDTKGEHQDICPVCRVRPAREDQRTCLECNGRRQRIEGYDWSDRASGKVSQSAMLGEIADRNDRLALVVARFGLDEWLDGRFTRSCFVKEPCGIAKLSDILPNVRELSHERDRFEEWTCGNPTKSHVQMAKVFEGLVKGSADSLGASIFGRGAVGSPLRLNRDLKTSRETWDADLAHFQEEMAAYTTDWNPEEKMFSAVCAKTPTPSTTLDVWRTTRSFFERLAGEHRAVGRTLPAPFIQSLPGMVPRKRRWLRVKNAPNWLRRQHKATVELPRYGREFMHVPLEDSDESVLWVISPAADLPSVRDRVAVRGSQQGETGEVVVTEVCPRHEEVLYWPYRVLSASPDLLMVLMPANVAAAFTHLIARQYREEFGKVKGRLPLAIGNVFFPSYLPMFSALDAAWRMTSNFRQLQGPNARVERHLDLSGLNLGLGDGARDNFHAYAVTAQPWPGSARSPAGWVTQVAELEELSKKGPVMVIEKPNLYDGVVLGGSGDRLNLALGSSDPPTRPEKWRDVMKRDGRQQIGMMFLEEFEQILAAWEALKASGASEGAIRNFWFALAQRASPGAEGWSREAFSELGKTLGRYYCGDAWSGELDEAFTSEALRKALVLHWSVLKEHLDSGEVI